MRRARKKRLDWRPALNKLLDPIFDPIPKELKKRHGAEAYQFYYWLETSDYRRYKNTQYRKFLVKLPFLIGLGLLLGDLLGSLLVFLYAV